MINSITLRKVASYDDTGVHIDLKKVNFFFGYNGSGKSTIAKYLYDLSLDTNTSLADFNYCSQVGYNSTEHQILTFDENFTELNFNRNPTLKGVFSLNQANDLIDNQIVSEEASIEHLKASIEKKVLRKEAVESDRRKHQTSLLDECWRERSPFATFTKASLGHSGSKPNHLQEIKGKIKTLPASIPTLEELRNRYQTLYESDLKNISASINPKLYKEIRLIERKLEMSLQEVIVGNEDVDIAALIQQVNSRSWVEAGIKFLDQTGDTCPFCQQETIDEDLKRQFDAYFDSTYRRKIQNLVDLQTSYKRKTDEFLLDILNIQNQYNPNNLVSNLYISIQSHFNTNSVEILNKVQNPNERKRITSLCSYITDLSSILKLISENNKTFAELNSKRSTFVSDIWMHMASKSKVRIDDLEEREKKYDRILSLIKSLVQSLETAITTCRRTIETLRTQTVNTREAVDKINLILKNSGFDGFEIAERNTVNNISQYFLKRPIETSINPIFKSLSEGEKNFISFLYFFQLCLNIDDLQNNSSKKKIIVIDDPVSSLDSQALFVVSTLVHSMIARKGEIPKADKREFRRANICQVFVLTHNLYFYKEVSFDKRPMCTDFWHYRIIKINNRTSITGQQSKTIHDDYSLLWNTIKELKANLPATTSLNIVIANCMRRIIESYVNFVGYGRDSWSSVLCNNPDDPTYYLKCAFISMINDESHKVTALDSIYYQKVINEQPQVLFDVFAEIFRSIGTEHYKMMMGENFED